ncbi:MAG: CinA family protein [Candidatus Omnitrophica bacterium]|nr:CinA family protein [Candidatus Omnitrophota bacterium]
MPGNKNLNELISLLKKRGQTIAVAESLTGGYVSYLFTKIPGSSKAFKLGTVVYSLEAKHKLFKLPLKKLNSTQGVSEEIAKILAKGVKARLNTDFGASIVGFAGPKAEKNMKGIVFMGLAKKDSVISQKKKLQGERDTVRKKASYALIEFVLNNIK